MRTARLLTVSCSAQEVCPTPPMQTPPDAELLWMQTTLVMWPVMHAGKPSPPREQNEWHTVVKNITLPQTSFAGGNKKAFQ